MAYLPGWSNLPEGIVFQILDELLEFRDYVRFSTVCKEWYSVAKHYYHTTKRWHRNTTLPMLLNPSYIKKDDNTTTEGRMILSLYSIWGKRVCANNIQLPVDVHPEARLVTCSHGWLAINESRNTLCLFNPFNTSVPPIRLRIDKLPSVQKIVLSADPALNPYTCVVVAVLYGEFAFTKLRGQEQKCWTRVPTSKNLSNVLIYKNQLYTVSDHISGDRLIGRRLDSFDILNITSHQIAPKKVVEFPFSYGSLDLVESTTAGMWLVRRTIEGKDYDFRVFKVVFEDRGGNSLARMVEVKSIGDEALFLGRRFGDSISVLASEIQGCQPNSIYYSALSLNVVRIFNLKDGSTTQLMEYEGFPQLPLWIVPPFCGLS